MTGRMLIAAFLAILAAIAYNTYQGVSNASSLSSAQTKTCLVQKRGLSAQPHLTRAMSDLVTLVTPKPGQTVPPGQQATFALVGDLRGALASYVAIESKQPKHRTCG